MVQEFGEIVESVPSFEEFGEVIQTSDTSAIPGLKKRLSQNLSKDIESLKNIGKGVYKGILDVPEAIGGGLRFLEESLPKKVLESLGVKGVTTPSEIGFKSQGSQIQEAIQNLQSLLPEEESEDFLTEATRRLTRSAAALPAGVPAFGSLLGAEAGGLTARKGAEALGVGKEGQELADILGGFAGSLKSAFSKTLIPKNKIKKFVESARKLGLSEKEITPLIQSEKKLGTLSKFAKKGEKTRKLFKQIENKLGDSYETIREKSKDLSRLPFKENKKIYQDFEKIKKDFETTLAAAPDKKGAIAFIDDAMKEVRNKGATPEKLINFWQDINQAVNWRAIKGGKKKLAELKKPILEALKKSSPSLAEDFEVTNQLYSKFKNVSKKLRPDLIDKWIDKGELGTAALAIATNNPSLLKKVGTVAGASILSRELLTNPRFQNISKKLMKSIKEDKPRQINALLKIVKRDLEKKYPKEKFNFGIEEKKEEKE